MSIVQRYHNTIFLPGIGCIKTDPIKFEFEKGFKPTQPHRRGIQYHHRDPLSQHLDLIRKEGPIENVHPR